MGEGLLVFSAAEMRIAGKPIDEVNDWVVGHIHNLCHWFTVDDLILS